MELLKSLAGVDAVHVPYKGSAAQATTDLLAGRVAMSFVNTSATLQHVRDGRLRAIAVAELKRIDAAPEIPTLAESVPGFSDAVARLRACARAPARDHPPLERPRSRRSRTRRSRALLGNPASKRPDDARAVAEFVRAENAKWADIIRRSERRQSRGDIIPTGSRKWRTTDSSLRVESRGSSARASPVEVVEALRRDPDGQPASHAFCTVAAEKALAWAREAARAVKKRAKLKTPRRPGRDHDHGQRGHPHDLGSTLYRDHVYRGRGGRAGSSGSARSFPARPTRLSSARARTG
jgi:hypothetical protein